MSLFTSEYGQRVRAARVNAELSQTELGKAVQPMKAIFEVRASFDELVLRKLAEGYGITEETDNG